MRAGVPATSFLSPGVRTWAGGIIPRDPAQACAGHLRRDKRVSGNKGETSRAAVWFVHSTSGEPMGQVYRAGKEAVPDVGARVSDGGAWSDGEVVSWTELRSACEMRRFRVVIRVLGA